MLLFRAATAQTARFIHKPLESMENRCAGKSHEKHAGHKSAKELSKWAQKAGKTKSPADARLIVEGK
jgi:hypothetical protein